MDVIREINEVCLSSEGSEDEEEVEVVRRPYSLQQRAVVSDLDDIEFHRYFRIAKSAFWKLHGLVQEALDGNPSRLCFFM